MSLVQKGERLGLFSNQYHDCKILCSNVALQESLLNISPSFPSLLCLRLVRLVPSHPV